MTLLIENQQDLYPFDRVMEEKFNEILSNAIKILNINVPVEVSLLLTDNKAIRGLNHKFRNVDKATDVLSFPMNDFDANESINNVLMDSIAMQGEEALLGDIVISVERAIEQADEYDHSIERELGFLMTHGLLHLLGYDHEIDDSIESEMRSLEEKILENVGLTRN